MAISTLQIGSYVTLRKWLELRSSLPRCYVVESIPTEHLKVVVTTKMNCKVVFDAEIVFLHVHISMPGERFYSVL
jgi:hypothetical protein